MPISKESPFSIMNLVFDIFMIIAPTFGYFAQILTFRSLQTSKGFSKTISLILIVSNILRIFFWFGKRFYWALLAQSIAMILMQIYLLYESLKYTNLNKYMSVFDYKNFWEWPFIIDYVFFIICFIIILCLLVNIITFQNLIFVELLGSLSAMVEASLAIPQIISNFKHKSTESLSTFLVANWLLGDIIKTFYFLKTFSPIQLVLCGIFQIIIDIGIIFQIFIYEQKLTDINNTNEIIKSDDEFAFKDS